MAIESTMLPLGTPAPPFALPEPATGRTVTLEDFAAAPALAVTPEEADRLRADIEAFLADPSASSMEWMGEGFSFRNGEVSVEAAGDAYEILIPGLVVVYDEPPYGYGDPAHVEVTLGDADADVTEYRRMGTVVRDASVRANELVEALLLLARTEAQAGRRLSKKVPADLSTGVSTALSAMRKEFGGHAEKSS